MAVNCRSEEGITIGLIDSLITISRIVVRRKINHPDVREALKDLASDADVARVMYSAKAALEEATDGRDQDSGRGEGGPDGGDRVG